MDSVFCTRLLDLMHQHGLSDKALERELNLPKDSVYNWTHGVTKSYNKYISVLAKRFKVTADYLLGTDKQKTKSTAEEQLLQIFNQLDADAQMDLLETAQTLLKRHAKKNSSDSVNEVTA